MDIQKTTILLLFYNDDGNCWLISINTFIIVILVFSTKEQLQTIRSLFLFYPARLLTAHCSGLRRRTKNIHKNLFDCIVTMFISS